VELNLRKQCQWFFLDVSNSAGGVKIRQQELRIWGLLTFCLHIPRFILLFLRWKSIIRCTTTTHCSDVGTRFWEEAILHIISRFSSLCGAAWQVKKIFTYLSSWTKNQFISNYGTCHNHDHSKWTMKNYCFSKKSVYNSKNVEINDWDHNTFTRK